MEINLKLTISFFLPAVFTVLLIACGDSQPLPDIDATVDARVAEERAAPTTVSGLVVECAYTGNPCLAHIFKSESHL